MMLQDAQLPNNGEIMYQDICFETFRNTQQMAALRIQFFRCETRWRSTDTFFE